VIYDLAHVTTYSYAAPVARSQHLLRLEPRTTATQRCLGLQITIDPKPSERHTSTDYFGNPTVYANLDQPHDQLVVGARGRVGVAGDNRLLPEPGPAWEQVRDRAAADRSPAGLEVYQYVFDSPMAGMSDAMRAYAEPSFAPGRPLLAAVEELNQRIYDEFTYDPTATTMATPVGQALAQRAGVCQDFAHVMLGCLRSMGLPARYMSGYVRPDTGAGEPTVRGAGASHAWVAVYLQEVGWVEYDPTNQALPGRMRTDHITLAWGRDYSDVAPVEGIALGGGEHEVSVRVTVSPAPGAMSPAYTA
jgi:transglutaminase-like putative cysteine protease